MLGNSVSFGDPDSALETPFSSWRARTETPNKGLSLYFPFGYILWWGSVVPYKNHMILRMIFRSGHIDIFGQLGS
jgi:hypothetical protein